MSVTEKTRNRDAALGCLVLIGILLLLGMCTMGGGEERDPKAAYVALYQSVLKAAGPCDERNRAALAAAGGLAEGGDVVAAYSTVSRATAACQTSWLEIGKLKAPSGLVTRAEASTEKALKHCEMAYYDRYKALEAMAKALDGDSRPSVLASIKDQASAADSGILICLAGLIGGASDAGVDANSMVASYK